MTDDLKPNSGFSNDFPISYSFLFFLFFCFVLAIMYLHDFLPHKRLHTPSAALWTFFSVISVDTDCDNRPDMIVFHVTHCVFLSSHGARYK